MIGHRYSILHIGEKRGRERNSDIEVRVSNNNTTAEMLRERSSRYTGIAVVIDDRHAS